MKRPGTFSGEAAAEAVIYGKAEGSETIAAGKTASELELYIGDDMEKKAAALLDFLKEGHSEIAFGKP